MDEGRLYIGGGAVAFLGLCVLTWTQVGVFGWALVVTGLCAVGLGIYKTQRRTQRVKVEIEGEHLHPIPVLDAPKGTFDLIAGLTVQVHNRQDEPVEIRIDTLLYHRNSLKWDRPVSDAPPVPLLTSSVVPGRSSKSFFVRNYIRLPDELDELTTDHFVKLIANCTGLGKSVLRAFLAERFELPKEKPPAASLAKNGDNDAPLLPFGERATQPIKAGVTSVTARFRRALARTGTKSSPTGEIKIHPLRKGADSLEGLIDEINAELGEDPSSGR